MSEERSPGKPTTRRYSDAEKDQAVRMVLQLRKELGSEQGTVGRVARQLGIGVESLRGWVKQREVDGGFKPGLTTADSEELKALRQEVRELRRANEILKRASSFFAAELDRPQK
jgi:transposase